MGYQTQIISMYEADKKRLKAVVAKRRKMAQEKGEKPPSLSEVVRELIAQEAQRLNVVQ